MTLQLTTGNAAEVYRTLGVLLDHLPAFGLTLRSIVVDDNGAVTVETKGHLPIPKDQLDHVGLVDDL